MMLEPGIKRAKDAVLTTDLVPSEDGQRVPTDEHHFEWWYFDGVFDDGSSCVVTYLTKKYETRLRGALAPSIQLNIGLPDGAYRQFLHSYPSEEYSAASDACDVSIGENWVRGDLESYQLHAEGDDLAADLTLRRLIPGWRMVPPLTPEEAARQRLAWQCVIPSGTVAGTLTYDGSPHEVSGTCYHDHQWGIPRPFPQLSPFDYWYWGRGKFGQYSIVFFDIVPKAIFGGEKRGIHGLMLGRGGDILTLDAGPARVSTGSVTEDKGIAYPQHLELEWEGEQGQLRLVVSTPRIIADIAKYLRFLSDAHLTVRWDGEETEESARMIWEVMHLSYRGQHDAD